LTGFDTDKFAIVIVQFKYIKIIKIIFFWAGGVVGGSVEREIFLRNIDAVKPVYNDHPRDPKFVAIVDRLVRGNIL